MNLRFLLVPVFSLFMLAGCAEEIITPVVQENILGVWGLRSQSGTAPAVCTGELLQFNNDGTAISLCPDKKEVYVNYTASNNVLTFTDNNVQYNIEKPSDTNLVLIGINVDRTLKYGSEF